MNVNVNTLTRYVRNLCVPAFAYLVLSLVSFILLISQNIKDSRKFCLGKLSCQVPHVALIFAAKLLYIAFWTWAINSLCKSGYKRTAWVLLFLPVIMFFVLTSLLLVLLSMDKHGMVVIR